MHPDMTGEQWQDWTERWIKSEFPRDRLVTYLVLYDQQGLEWFVKWAHAPHVADEAGTGLCDDCGRRCFVWAANWALGRKCLLCFKRNAP
jgi:hypothetical protein